ncbi:MAG: diguanylate cyclase, partial [Butyrivibrio sp.]|nr:diguanylate cyclase [Butyrivibrio sp.]
MQAKNKGKISHVLQAINIVPLLLFGTITLLLSYRWFTNAMYEEVERGLVYVAVNTNTIMDVAYPGDYELVGDTIAHLYKGGVDITTDAYELIDRVKADTELEITIFYQDMRVLTTIHDSSGSRFVGTKAPDIVIKEVLKGGEPRFYTNTLINSARYFSYYMPISDSNGNIMGMIFVGKPSQEVNTAVQQALYPLIFTTIVTIIIISLFLFFYTKRLINALQHIRGFLVEVATGNLTAKLDSTVSQRNDEFGDIGRSALSMQRSLRTMVEQDALTELFNRRCADQKLRQLVAKHQKQNTPFCLTIGDVDFFKKVNDTYGHECGDLVLKNISAKLKEHMRNYGFAARWGGEEFLLVYDNVQLPEAHRLLEQLLDDIRAMETQYNDNVIKVTMTFGLTAGNTDDISKLLLAADENLYSGKADGRDRIVWTPADAEPDAKSDKKSDAEPDTEYNTEPDKKSDTEPDTEYNAES